MQILIISGFLGAGKTTFIKKMVEKTEQDFVILENEYGELPVDGAILEEAKDLSGKDINIWELTEGCVCCSVKADFAASILTIANALDPEFLIVEPTGVGKLSNIMQNIGCIEYDRISLLRPITLIDAHCFESDLAEFEDIYSDQIMNTDHIILTKIENTPSDRIEFLTDALHAMNPEALIETEHYSLKGEDWWNDLLKDTAGRPVLKQSGETDAPDLENVGIKDIHLPSIGALVALMEQVIRGRFGYIRRAKGTVVIDCVSTDVVGTDAAGQSDEEDDMSRAGECARFDVVEGEYSITGCEPTSEANAIFIGRRLKKDELKQYVLSW